MIDRIGHKFTVWEWFLSILQDYPWAYDSCPSTSKPKGHEIDIDAKNAAAFVDNGADVHATFSLVSSLTVISTHWLPDRKEKGIHSCKFVIYASALAVIQLRLSDSPKISRTVEKCIAEGAHYHHSCTKVRFCEMKYAQGQAKDCVPRTYNLFEGMSTKWLDLVERYTSAGQLLQEKLADEIADFANTLEEQCRESGGRTDLFKVASERVKGPGNDFPCAPSSDPTSIDGLHPSSIE